MKKKWLVGIAIVAIVLVFFLATPGLAASLIAIVTGTPDLCDNTPYDQKCVCLANMQKVRASFISYMCEPIPEPPQTGCIYPIDTSNILSEEFQTMAFECATEYLEMNYPECNTIDCMPPMFRNYGTTGTKENPKQYIKIECGEGEGEYTGIIYWAAILNAETGEPHSIIETYCNSK